MRAHQAIDRFKIEIQTTVKNNRVTGVQGPTGVGKTTKVVEWIAEQSDGLVLCGLPRKIGVVKVAKRVAGNQGVGGRVGFAYKGSYAWSEKTKILYCTLGVIVKILTSNARRRAKVTHIILDEPQERTPEVDIICYLCKHVLTTMKLTLLSATLPLQLLEYHGVSEYRIPLPDTPYPVDVKYLDEIVTKATPRKHCKNPWKSGDNEWVKQQPSDEVNLDLVEWTLREVVPKGSGGILVFLPTVQMISDLGEMLRDSMPEIDVRKLYSGRDMSFSTRNSKNKYSVYLATNVAEVSITLQGIDTVVDTGMSLRPLGSESRFKKVWASQQSVDQRTGRVGRVQPGVVYRLWPSWFVLPRETPPFILSTPLHSIILMLLSCSMQPSVLSCFPTPPSTVDVANTLRQLHVIKAVTSEGVHGVAITPFGSTVANLPLPPNAAKALLYSVLFGCFKRFAPVVAAECQLYAKELTQTQKYYRKRIARAHRSDLLVVSDVYNEWTKAVIESEKKEICEKYGVGHRYMAELQVATESLQIAVGKLGWLVNYTEKEDVGLGVLLGICWVCCDGKTVEVHNKTKAKTKWEYLALPGGVRVWPHPSSLNAQQRACPAPLYSYLRAISSSQVYLTGLSPCYPAATEILNSHDFSQAFEEKCNHPSKPPTPRDMEVVESVRNTLINSTSLI